VGTKFGTAQFKFTKYVSMIAIFVEADNNNTLFRRPCFHV